MMATVSPEIEPNCIPTTCSITQGNGACLINNKKTRTHAHARTRTHTHARARARGYISELVRSVSSIITPDQHRELKRQQDSIVSLVTRYHGLDN